METSQRPRARIRITWEGIFWLLLAAVLLTQGWYRNIGLLAFLAFFLFGLFLLQAGYLLWWRRGLRHVRIVRRLPQIMFAGRPFDVEIELENPRTRQVAVRVEDCSVEGVLRWHVPVLRRGERRVLRQATWLEKRGRHNWSQVRLSTGFPLGLLRRTVIYTQKAERIVYPAVGQINLAHLEWLLQVSSVRQLAWRASRRPVPGAEFEFHGLRDYRSGDSPRYIHWRSSARAGKLLVREMEPPATEEVMLILDAWRPSSPSPSSQTKGSYPPLEDAISLAASLVMALQRDPGREVSLVILDMESRRLTAVTGTPQVWSLLEALALVQGHQGLSVVSWGQLLGRLSGSAPIVWITSRPHSAELYDIPLPVALVVNAQDLAALPWYKSPNHQLLPVGRD
ncbi:MAG: DUF58 domain-containing protein [Gemmatales bacterium]|nr:DUF58 domain-containing protein [Gemmatales bacterium]MDW7993624.1 DUF58 domain-containing protein [Gemmatales bacterium]